jgi:FkbM family methyltransferase
MLAAPEVMNRILGLLGDHQAFKAFLSWPTFSFTSYQMVSGLKRQGIIPRTVIDVGANIGQFAVASAKLFKDVHIFSFEPQTECVEQLKRHADKLGNIQVYSFALGHFSGQTDFNVNSHSHSSSILPLTDNHMMAFPEARQVGTTVITVKTMDQVFAEQRLQSPILLKLDVQGYEANILAGGQETLTKVDYIVLETSFKPMYKGEMLFLDIVELMSNYGFDFLRPIGWLQEPKTGETLQMDALFVNQASRTENS